MSLLEPYEPHELADLEERLIDRFSPPLRPDEVQRCLAQSAASYQDARVRTYLPVLIERAAVERLQAIVRQRTRIHLVSQGGAIMSAVMTPNVEPDVEADWYGLSADDVCRRLDVDPATGLSAAEVVKRREQYGSNKLAEEAKEPSWRAFLRQYRDLMQLVLLGAAIVSIVALQDVSTGLVVIGLTVVNALMGLHQEGKAAESVAALRQMLIMTARVRRDGERVEIPAEELVPGDIVGFEAGDKVPADGRILVAATLEIEEAGLTGREHARGQEPRPGHRRRRAAR